MSSSRYRPSGASSRPVTASSRLRMDRNPVHTRISDPSLPAGKRREIDNVIKKARALPNGQWDKKLIEVEERDPNRWRHSGYKKMYIEGESSSDDSRRRKSRSRSRNRGEIRNENRGADPRDNRDPREAARDPRENREARDPRGAAVKHYNREAPKKPPVNKSRRPPSPTRPRGARSPSGSSLSSCSDDSCSVCSPKTRRNHRSRSRSISVPRTRAPHNVPPMPKPRPMPPRPRPASPPPKEVPRGIKRRADDKPKSAHKAPPMSLKMPRPRLLAPEPRGAPPEPPGAPPKRRRIPVDIPKPKPPRVPAEVIDRAPPGVARKHKEKSHDKTRPRIKVEGASRQRPASPDSSGSDSSESITSCPTAATKLTLSERFGKMAQWSIDRRDIENMRITKDSNGGELKVMIEEGYQSPRGRYSSPAPTGHFPEELAATGPLGLASWDDVRVRYDYYKSRGYLRDLDLQDYIKWEEWWYRYQQWLKQERYYEQWERQGPRRRRKRVPISQRLH